MALASLIPTHAVTWKKLAAAFGLALAVAHPAHAQSVAEFYKGKTVQVIVGFGVGGGYDLYAFDPNVEISIEEFTDIIGRHFRAPKEGLGNDNTPVAHMWRTLINPDAPL